jgi:hypothetical protein
VHFQIALTFASRNTVGFLKPPSGGFPEGLLDRAFYARVCGADDSQSPFSTGLQLKALALGY